MTKGDIVLGNKVEDVVTGFKGIATSRLEHMDGRIEYGVIKQGTENKYPDVVWIPGSHVKKIDDGIIVERVRPILGFHGGGNDKPRN